MAGETSRLSAAEIFERVTAGAEEEIRRRPRNLLLSAVAAGLAMGVSALGVALLRHAFGDGGPAEAAAMLAYPLGFVIVVLGRQQLFTENTLFPVALVLDRREHLGATARLWGLVLVGNVIGAALFGVLAVVPPTLTAEVRDALLRLGVEAAAPGWGTVFWTGVVGGWLIALMAWLVTASTDTIGQVVLVLLVTYVVGVGHFAHSVAGSAEVLSAVVGGSATVADYAAWLTAAVLGNAVGGVVMVALLNYGQVHQEQGSG